MKRILLTVTLLVLIVTCLVACGNDTAGDTTTALTGGADSTPAQTEPAGSDETTALKGTDVTTPADTQPLDPDVEPIVTEDYTAIPDTFEWVAGELDYDFVGDGKAVTNKVNSTYNGYTKTYYILAEDGTKTESSRDEVRKITYMIGASFVADKTAKTVEVTVQPCELVVKPSWKSVTAKAGSYLMFEFTTNFNSNFYMTVTADEGGAQSSAAYTQGGVKVSGADGKYTGIAKCTVPYAAGKTFYINICLDSTAYPIVATVPVEITAPKYESEFSLIFQGDWELIKDKDYLPNLIDLFYNVYPRLYARFGIGTEPKQITFMADKNYDGVAYCSGTTVCVAVDYANSNPKDIGFFSHEITHSIQQYKMLNYDNGGSYNGVTYDAWWTENMASYGGFRYFHWGYSTKFIQFYDAKEFADWGADYAGYGDGCQVFFTYLDWKFPTTDKNGDGEITVDEYGVIDRINYTIKTSSVMLYDTPTNPNTPFNQAVYAATGGEFDCIDAIRSQFNKDCLSGAFQVVGFRDFKDNFITENVPGIPNPTYPMYEPVKKGDKTNAVLDTAVTEGTNLALNATIVSASSNGTSKNQITNTFDGDLTTKWQAGAVRDDYKYQLAGYPHEFIIDLGEAKKFDTYTLVNAGIKENDAFNTKEWELFVSDDGKTWTSVDYQKDMASEIVSVNIGDTTARYVMLRVFATDRSETGTVRLYEFMIFDQK